MSMHRPIEKHDGSPEDCTRCNPHLAREKRAAFVKAWQAEHYEEVYTTPTCCPLCNKALQSNAGGSYRLVEDHTDEHGADWTAYMALSSASEDGQG